MVLYSWREMLEGLLSSCSANFIAQKSVAADMQNITEEGQAPDMKTRTEVD